MKRKGKDDLKKHQRFFGIHIKDPVPFHDSFGYLEFYILIYNEFE